MTLETTLSAYLGCSLDTLRKILLRLVHVCDFDRERN